MSKPGIRKQLKKKRREEKIKKRKHVVQENEHIGMLYYQAETDALDGRWVSVIRKCENILKTAPCHILTLRLLAHAYYITKNATQEAAVLRKLAALLPEDRHIGFNLIVAEVNQKNLETGLSLIKDFIRKFRASHAELKDLRRMEDYCKSMVARTSRPAQNPLRAGPILPILKSPEAGMRVQAPGTTSASKSLAARAPSPAMAHADLPRMVPPITVSLNMKDDASFFQNGILEENALFWFRQRLRLAHIRMRNEFDELICVPLLKDVIHFAYQAETVRKVLKYYRGRVLLSDEVGLGKTIEAAMIVKEYLVRGMIKSVLVLCPPSLVHQWNTEFKNKFAIQAHAQNNLSSSRKGGALWEHPVVIASIHTAKSRANSKMVLEKSWDMVIVDEAHHLKNRRTLSWSLVNSIRKKFILLLSATPVQNNLIELYNLITLLKPGAFPPEKEFLRVYCDPENPRNPKNTDQLRLLVRDCMVRNTRAGCGIPFPKRFATTFTVQFNGEEQEIYNRICEIAHRLHLTGSPRVRLMVRTLLERAGAHLPLALGALRNIGSFLEAETPDLPPGLRTSLMETVNSQMTKIANLGATTAKMKKLIALLQEGSRPIIIFCRHSSTVQYVCGELLLAGVPFSSFHGGMSAEERIAAIDLFHNGEARALVSSESGGEGHNLQFCNALVNFDLPWNPMQIEQRIGRIHRIGQDRDVFVFNLCYAGTLEEKILGILETKIRMFELVIGEVDSILGNLDEKGGFSEVVMNLWVHSDDAAGRAKAFEDLGESLLKSREEYLDACRLDGELFGKEMET